MSQTPEVKKTRKKAYRVAHSEEIKIYQKTYRAAHREERAAYNATHQEEERIRSRDYYIVHREEKATYSKAFRIAHREELAARQKTYRAAHQEEILAYRKEQGNHSKIQRRQHIHGLSQVAFNALLESQGRVCVICKKATWNGRGPFVDHDHTTGKVRGLLCSNCNAAIGLLHDNAERARAIANYLESHA